MKIVTRFMFFLLAGSALFFLQSCSADFYLEPSGRLGDVTFTFYESPENRRPFSGIGDITVLEPSSASETGWKVIWELSGRGDMDSLKYGQEYRGLHSKRGPEPLRRGGTYRVLAFSGAYSSAAEFRIDSRGRVVFPKRPNQAMQTGYA